MCQLSRDVWDSDPANPQEQELFDLLQILQVAQEEDVQYRWRVAIDSCTCTLPQPEEAAPEPAGPSGSESFYSFIDDRCRIVLEEKLKAWPSMSQTSEVSS